MEGFKDASDWAVKFWHYQMWLMIELAYWRQLTPLTSGAELLLDFHIEKFKPLCKLATNLVWSFQAANVKRTVKADKNPYYQQSMIIVIAYLTFLWKAIRKILIYLKPGSRLFYIKKETDL